MTEYHKINSVFKRDERGRFTSEFACAEFEYLRNSWWVFDEKIDGTNIRVLLDGYHVRFGGKTDAAQIPATLFARLQEMFPVEKFASFEPPVTLYGEGYGAKIQKGGGNYRSDQSFVLFDVRVGSWWLLRQDVEDIAQRMGLEIAPILGRGTIDDAIALTKNGFNSNWGPFRAEGIVMRPEVPLYTRRGERIITKLKMKDWT
jgi:ATP-dependent RNA circularization protein (DNA/RNA ligase family)